MKTEVYSWRVSAQRKAELESEARRDGMSLAGLLERITTDWLQERRESRNGDEAEQAWRVVAPVLSAWSKDLVPLLEYPAGSEGPGTRRKG